MVNIEWSSDWKSNVNVCHNRSAAKVISAQRTFAILSQQPLALSC